jgi:hypothetical protein
MADQQSGGNAPADARVAGLLAGKTVVTVIVAPGRFTNVLMK